MWVVYCPTCRADFFVREKPPPYSVVHVIADPPIHLHPITRERVFVLREGIEVAS